MDFAFTKCWICIQNDGFCIQNDKFTKAWMSQLPASSQAHVEMLKCSGFFLKRSDCVLRMLDFVFKCWILCSSGRSVFKMLNFAYLKWCILYSLKMTDSVLILINFIKGHKRAHERARLGRLGVGGLSRVRTIAYVWELWMFLLNTWHCVSKTRSLCRNNEKFVFKMMNSE